MNGAVLPGWLLLSAWGVAGGSGFLSLVRRRGIRRRARACRSEGGRTPTGWRAFRRMRRALERAVSCVRGREYSSVSFGAARLVAAAAAGIGTAAVLGEAGGLTGGLLLAAGLYRWLPRPRSPTVRRTAWEQQVLAGQLPMTAELLAACLSSSGSPSTAVAAVGRSVGSPMSRRLGVIAAELSLGAPPELSWRRLGEECPVLAPLGRCLVRTSISGAPPAGPLLGLAQAQRASAVRAAHVRVRRAGVLATAPLGICFLPAFILISVVPVVLGLTSAFTRDM